MSTKVKDVLDQHPGIHFQDGRPKVVDGISVYVIVKTVRLFGGSLAKAAAYYGFDPKIIETGMRYYEHHREEMDAWIAEREAASDKAYLEWCAANGVKPRPVPDGA